MSRLSRKLGMGINHVGAVHAAGAAPHDKPVESLQELLEADFVDELVLGGHVTAAQDDPVRAPDEGCCLIAVPAVQHDDFCGFDT